MNKCSDHHVHSSTSTGVENIIQKRALVVSMNGCQIEEI
jgi:hypothetical protein